MASFASFQPHQAGPGGVAAVLASCVEVAGSAEDACSICMCEFVVGGGEDESCVKLPACQHTFHPACIKRMLEMSGRCAICSVYYVVQLGSMPPGTMTVTVNPSRLPGHPDCGTITIHYSIPSGIQGPDHPSPGAHYSGASRAAYLPDSAEGRDALRLLRVCFDRRLTFTVGTSLTTGVSNTVVWNGVHHKTSVYGGSAGFGFPDETYLSRLFDELAAKGITR